MGKSYSMARSSPHCNSGTEYTLGLRPCFAALRTCSLLATHQERAATHRLSKCGRPLALGPFSQLTPHFESFGCPRKQCKLISQRGVAPRGDSSCEGECYRLVEIETMAPPKRHNMALSSRHAARTAGGFLIYRHRDCDCNCVG